MRTILIAIAAGVSSALVTLAWTNSGDSLIETADAQLAPRQLPVPTQPRSRPSAPRLAPIAEPAVTPIATTTITPAEQVNRSVYERCSAGVVNISATTVRRTLFGAVPQSGDGSGVVIDLDGHILTNYHVVSGASRVSVTLADGSDYPGEVVGVDPLNDIAVLKIDAPADKLTVIPLGDSSSLFVGQNIYAIGNPFGLQQTLSTGIIASLGRSLHVREDWVVKAVIQIDAAINPGNSGGPLLDASGRLIGINTAIAARTEQSAGIGFAIPVNLVRRSLPDLFEHGRVIRGDLGITVSETKQGLTIVRLAPKGPGEKAGLRGPMVEESRTGGIIYRRIRRDAADVIVALNGEQISDAAEFFAQIGDRRPGDQVELTVIRDGKLVTVPVILGDE